MNQPNDDLLHRNPELTEKPLDAPNQSLADALRSSFSVLKAIMVVIALVYLFSNVRSIKGHEQALKMRLGSLLPTVYEPGLVWALPEPIDEIIVLPTRKSNELRIDSHTFGRRANEVGKPLSFLSRSNGLHPTMDGALLTADTGLVHTRWKITYKFDDVSSFVTRIAGDQVEAAETLITIYVETNGIAIASEMTAEEFIRTKVDDVQFQMRRRVNERLAAIESGIVVTLVEMYELTPPIQIRGAFDATQKSESLKQQEIRRADKERTNMLSIGAGSVYPKLVELLEQIDRKKESGEPVEDLQRRVDFMLENEIEGEAARLVKEAGTYRATVVSQMQSDVDRYRTLIPEYRRSPLMLVNRLWEKTKQDIFEMPGLTTLYRPAGLREFRMKIPLDAQQVRANEEKRLQTKEFDVDKLRPVHARPVGWEYD